MPTIYNWRTGEAICSVEAESLEGACLEGRFLEHADLKEAALRGASLRGAKLADANLFGADLSGADLRDADLRGSDLRKADITGAQLAGARLEEAWYHSPEQWPDGFDPQAHGAVLKPRFVMPRIAGADWIDPDRWEPMQREQPGEVSVPSDMEPETNGPPARDPGPPSPTPRTR
jgi:hypothetical protein